MLLLAGTLLHLGHLPTASSAMRGIAVIVLSLLPILLIGWLVRMLGDANGVVTLSLPPIIIAGPVVAIVYLCTLPWVIWRTDLLGRCRNHLRQFAPLYLIAGPPALTYVALCGTLSAWATIFWITRHPYQRSAAISHRDAIVQSGIFTMLHVLEWACSIVGAFGFAWLLHWLDLPRFWFFILFLSLSISAAYRTARLDPGLHFGTGPGILFTPEWCDIVPVILGLSLFAISKRPRSARDRNQQGLTHTRQ